MVTSRDAPMIVHHNHMIASWRSDQIIVEMININPQTINRRAGIIYT